MGTVVAIITHTPPFVWVILAVLMLRAIRSARARTVSLFGLLLIPALLILGGAASLSIRSVQDSIGWAVMAVIWLPIGFFTAPHPTEIDRAARTLRVPASIVAPVRLLLIFLVRYGLAVAIAMHPDRRAELTFATNLFSGGVAGYYLGWTIFLLRAYWRAPRGAVRAAS